MEGLKRQRSTVKGGLTRFINQLKSNEFKDNLSGIKVILERNESLFDKLDNIQTVADARTVIERVQQICTPSVTESPSIREQNEGAIRNNGANLPKLNVPKFNGNYSYWVKFSDSFTSMIDSNESISNVEKFYYLDSALSGEAARVISALGISEENYTIAWNAFKARYEDEI